MDGIQMEKLRQGQRSPAPARPGASPEGIVASLPGPFPTTSDLQEVLSQWAWRSLRGAAQGGWLPFLPARSSR